MSIYMYNVNVRICKNFIIFKYIKCIYKLYSKNKYIFAQLKWNAHSGTLSTSACIYWNLIPMKLWRKIDILWVPLRWWCGVRYISYISSVYYCQSIRHDAAIFICTYIYLIYIANNWISFWIIKCYATNVLHIYFIFVRRLIQDSIRNESAICSITKLFRTHTHTHRVYIKKEKHILWVLYAKHYSRKICNMPTA